MSIIVKSRMIPTVIIYRNYDLKEITNFQLLVHIESRTAIFTHIINTTYTLIHTFASKKQVYCGNKPLLDVCEGCIFTYCLMQLQTIFW